jgi:hypothetical protein
LLVDDDDHMYKLNFVRFDYKEFVKTVFEISVRNQSKRVFEIQKSGKLSYLFLWVVIWLNTCFSSTTFHNTINFNCIWCTSMIWIDPIFSCRNKNIWNWYEKVNYLFWIDHVDQDMIERDFSVEDQSVIQSDLIDLTYFLIGEWAVIQ